MKYYDDIMISLKTVSPIPWGGSIVQMGAVRFNYEDGSLYEDATFCQDVSLESCVSLGGLVHPESLTEWTKGWANLSSSEPVHIRTALTNLGVFFTGQPFTRVWCQDVHLEVPMLDWWAKTTRAQMPWKPWQLMDSRTLCNAAILRGAKLSRCDIQGRADEDCLAQISNVMTALRALGFSK